MLDDFSRKVENFSFNSDEILYEMFFLNRIEFKGF